MCLGILLVRLYTSLGAKIAVPVVLAVLALSVYRVFNPYTGLGVDGCAPRAADPQIWPPRSTSGPNVRDYFPHRRVPSPVARLGQMSLSASIVLSALIIYAGPTIKAFTVGEHYVATGGWGHRRVLDRLPDSGHRHRGGILRTLGPHGALLAGRGPWRAILALISGRG